MDKVSAAITVSLQRLRATYFGFMRTLQRMHLNMIGVLQGHEVPIPDSTLFELFENQFEDEKFREGIAIMQDEKRMTFHELQREADAVAIKILHLFGGDDKEQTIPTLPKIFGLFTLPGHSRIAAMLGLLKLKCAYLPLDFTLPAERMAAILQESGVNYVICDNETTETALQTVIDINSEITAVNIVETDKSHKMLKDAKFLDQDEGKKENNPLVCVLYTSGSTGVPKGVPLYSRNVINRLTWQWKELPFTKEDVGCHKTSMLFVDSLNEILSCLLKGVPIVILPKSETTQPGSFVKAIQRFHISRLVLVPSHLNMLIEYLQATKYLDKVFSLRTIISSGEELSLKTAKQFFNVFPLRSVLFNLYGSTETTGDITYDKWESSEDVDCSSMQGVMSLGKPVYNTCVMILDESGAPCAEGNVGHVYVSGLNIVTQYANKTYTKSNTFLPNSIFNKEGHGVLYSMGDVGMVKEGKLYYQGRCDGQVKVRGHRIDLHEIEQVVKDIDGVESCVVLPYKDINGYTLPVVFYLSKSGDSVTGQQMKSECERKLPKYALPRYMRLGTFPTQIQTGKIDRQRLLQLYRNKVTEGHTNAKGDEQPLGKDQQILSILARNISLPVEDINVKLNFFENGGNSLSAVSTISDLESEGFSITLAKFVSVKSIKELLECDLSEGYDVVSSLGSQYQAVMLNSIPNKEQAIDVLTQGFIQKNPLDVLAQTTEKSFKRLVKSFWQEILTDDLSVVIVDKNTRNVVATSIVLDLRTEISPVFDKPEVAEINNMVEEPVKRKLLKHSGKWVDAILNAVDTSLAEDTALSILEMMEEYVIDVVKKGGYDGIVTVNSHPVTMVSIRGSLILSSLEIQ